MFIYAMCCSMQHMQLHTVILSHDKVYNKGLQQNCRCDIGLKFSYTDYHYQPGIFTVCRTANFC